MSNVMVVEVCLIDQPHKVYHGAYCKTDPSMPQIIESIIEQAKELKMMSEEEDEVGIFHL